MNAGAVAVNEVAARPSELESNRRSERRDLWLLAGIVALAVVLRVYQLGQWSLDGDEIYTLRDSETTRLLQGSRPLLFFLNYHLVKSWTPLNEFTLRLLPALFGVLAVPVMYLLVRRTFSSRAGLFAAFLLAINPVHVLHSQNARYWSLVFLLSLIYPLAAYIGIRERKPGWLVLAVCTLYLAILAHPSAGLLVGGIVAWVVVTQLKWDVSFLERPSVRWGALATGVIVLLLSWRLVPLLQNWMSKPHIERLRGASLILSLADSLSLDLVLIGGAGIIWLWHDRSSRSLALLLTFILTVPTVLLVGLSQVTAVATAYLFGAAPVFFIGAGVMLDRLLQQDIAPWPKRLVITALLAMLVAASAPSLVSHYLDGGRTDFRAAAAHLRTRISPGDVVYSDEFPSLRHYLPGVPVEPLQRDSTRLRNAVTALPHGGRLWVVVLASKRGGFKAGKLGLGRLSDWMYANCQLTGRIGVARLDFRQNELQIYRCPPTPFLEVSAVSESR